MIYTEADYLVEKLAGRLLPLEIYLDRKNKWVPVPYDIHRFDIADREEREKEIKEIINSEGAKFRGEESLEFWLARKNKIYTKEEE